MGFTKTVCQLFPTGPNPDDEPSGGGSGPDGPWIIPDGIAPQTGKELFRDGSGNIIARRDWYEWSRNYLTEGPCTTPEKDVGNAANDIANLLTENLVTLIGEAQIRILSGAEIMRFMKIISEMLRFPLDLAEGNKLNVDQFDAEYNTSKNNQRNSVEVDLHNYLDCLKHSYIQSINEVVASNTINEKQKFERIDHHVALAGDIVNMLWSTFNEYARRLK